mmetsp:Transcript_6690/g.9795  ORF Transcript_6690/g.9795 Transcript_6690/m.9795 type:complete len:329 (-) Transcript_6690:261-1247(-)
MSNVVALGQREERALLEVTAAMLTLKKSSRRRLIRCSLAFFSLLAFLAYHATFFMMVSSVQNSSEGVQHNLFDPPPSSSSNLQEPTNIVHNLTIEQRFAYAPSSVPLSEFDRKRMNRLPPTYPLRVPAPIFVASLPKSGTSSVWKYFLCGGHMAAHHYSRVDATLSIPIGECIENNVDVGRPPFQNCGPYYVWSDNGYVTFPERKGNSTSCFYPSIHALDSFYAAYPEMTILVFRRNVTSWVKSVQKFQKIAERWTMCNRKGMIKKNNEAALSRFYLDHISRLKNFADQRPSITFIEMPLEGPTVGKELQRLIGIPASCWKNVAPGKK